MDNLKGVAVLEGYVAVNFHFFLLFNVKSPRADHPCHVSHFLLSSLTELAESLLDVFATGLEDGTYPRSSVELDSFSPGLQQQKELINQIHLQTRCKIVFKLFCIFDIHLQ